LVEDLDMNFRKGTSRNDLQHWFSSRMNANKTTGATPRRRRPGVDDKDQTWTGRREYLEDGRVSTSKTKRNRVASVGWRSEETDQSKHEVNCSRTEEGVCQKLPKDRDRKSVV